MDFLKGEISKLKTKTAASAGSNSWKNRSERERERQEQYDREQKEIESRRIEKQAQKFEAINEYEKTYLETAEKRKELVETAQRKKEEEEEKKKLEAEMDSHEGNPDEETAETSNKSQADGADITLTHFDTLKEAEKSFKTYSLSQKSKHCYAWAKSMMHEWKTEVKLQEDQVDQHEYQKIKQRYKQAQTHMKPLLQLLITENMNSAILDSIYAIAVYCQFREYVEAHSKYLELAIGNAPWPMGVTMVGIHERSGRSKIYSSQVAHILNDESQRKYLQCWKRLMSVSQSRFPAAPSKSVA